MHHPSFQGCGIQDELGWLVLSNWKFPQQVPQWSFRDKLKWLRREFLESPDVCSTQGQAFGVGVRGHHGFDMGTHLSEAAVYSSRSHDLFRFVHGRMEGRVVMCQHDSQRDRLSCEGTYGGYVATCTTRP